MRDRILRAAVLVTPSVTLALAAALCNAQLYLPAVVMLAIAAALFVVGALT